jgi:hypothetical protein
MNKCNSVFPATLSDFRRVGLTCTLLLTVVVASSCTSSALVPAVSQAPCPELPLERTRRLYDFTPVGPENLVIAGVDGCLIQIPLSEFRGHLAAEVVADERPHLTREDKRRHLDRLIDEHLLLMDAYLQKADEIEGVVEMLNRTRKMLLVDLLIEKEVDAKITTPEQGGLLRKQLLDRAFEKAQIIVSNESFAELKVVVKRVNADVHAVSANAGRTVDEIPADVRDRVLAMFQNTKLSIGDVLLSYLQMSRDFRPNLQQQEGLIELLKQILEQEILLAEAIDQGIDRTLPYLRMVELNRNSIVRMWSQDRSAKKAEEQMTSPDIGDRLRNWYRDHLYTRYTFKSKNGTQTVMPFEGNEKTVSNDYYDALRDRIRDEEARALRQGRKLVVNEALLDQA